MRIVSTSYSKSEDYNDPKQWLQRIRFYTGLLEQLAKDHQVTSIERINFEGQEHQNGVDYLFILLKNKVDRFPFSMHGLIKSMKPDVVIVNGFIFPLQIIQLRLFLGRKPLILVLHRAEKPFNGWKKGLQKLADKCVNAYLFASAEFGKQWVNNGNIRNKKKVYEIIQSSSSFQPMDRASAKEELHIHSSPTYLWVGRLEKNKDPLTVVASFIRIYQMYPSANLYMIFQTEELLDEIKSLIAESKTTKAIHLVGKVAHEKLLTWYSAADFIISGSHYEGSGIAVIEAMSCGCIPIVTDIVSFRKIAGECGFLYPPGNVDALFQLLQKSPGIDLAAQREKVLKVFHDELSFEAIADKINLLLNEFKETKVRR